MSKFLEQRRDWQLDQIVKDRDNGIISDAEAQEQILLAQERYDKARRWRDNVA